MRRSSQCLYPELLVRTSDMKTQSHCCCVADRTLITIASANRPGTLVEVVQGLTELGLDVHRARISSDGGWFVDGESNALLARLGSRK